MYGKRVTSASLLNHSPVYILQKDHKYVTQNLKICYVLQPAPEIVVSIRQSEKQKLAQEAQKYLQNALEAEIFHMPVLDKGFNRMTVKRNSGGGYQKSFSAYNKNTISNAHKNHAQHGGSVNIIHSNHVAFNHGEGGMEHKRTGSWHGQYYKRPKTMYLAMLVIVLEPREVQTFGLS